MDVDTFLDRIRQNLIDLISRELTDLFSARVQMITWIRFMVEVEDENGNVIGVNMVEKAFNSQMMDISLHHEDIKSHPECISNLTRFEDNYDWSGLEFPLSIKGISEFEKKNDVIVNILGVEEKKVYILRGKKYN